MRNYNILRSKNKKKLKEMKKIYENAGKSWTPDEEKTLINNIEKYHNNMDIISNIHGRSIKAIQMRIASLITKMLKNGDTRDQIKKIFHIDDIDGYILENMKNEDDSKIILRKLDQLEHLIMKILKRLPKQK